MRKTYGDAETFDLKKKKHCHETKFKPIEICWTIKKRTRINRETDVKKKKEKTNSGGGIQYEVLNF